MADAASAYEKNAQVFLQKRDQSAIGARTIAKWCSGLRQRATVLELGCGAGHPVTRVLDGAGLQLWAIDSSPSLIGEFKQRFPHITVQCTKVQDTDFFNKKFDAIVAVGLVFLLSETEQQYLIKRVSELLPPGGKFLFTAPIEIGEWSDTNTAIKCTSLGQKKYVAMLDEAGFELPTTYSDTGKNNYYDAVLG